MPIKYLNTKTGHVANMATPAEAASRVATHQKRTKRMQQQIIDRMDDSKRWQRVAPEAQPAPRVGAESDLVKTATEDRVRAEMARTDDQAKAAVRAAKAESEEAKAPATTQPLDSGEASKRRATTRRKTTRADDSGSTDRPRGETSGPVFTKMAGADSDSTDQE